MRRYTVENGKEIISFKSDKEFYTKEKSGRKNNTLRFRSELEDVRFEILSENLPSLEELYIRIYSEDKKEFFTRKVSDISFYNSTWIITWEHEMDK